MAKPKDGVDRREFVQGGAIASAFAFLGGSIPIFGKNGTQATQLDASKSQFNIDEQTKLPDGEEAVASASFPDPNGGTIDVRLFARTIETGTTRTTITHSVITSPSGQTSSHVSIVSSTTRSIENGYRNSTASSVNIRPDGTITRQSPTNFRTPLANPYEGMSPLQMFQQMMRDKQSGKPSMAQVQP